MSTQEVGDEKARLEKAIEENNAEEVLKSLEALGRLQVTITSIKDTRIGKLVGKLRKHENKDVCNASGNLVNQWKKLMEKKEEKDKEKEKEKDDSKKRKKEESKKEETKKSKAVSSPDSSQLSDQRRKCVTMLEQALSPAKESDVVSIESVAQSIEAELFKLWPDCGKDYNNKFRSLHFNLKNPKNPDLRDSVMNDSLSIQKLCIMSSHDMASNELKEERRRIAEWHLEAAKTKVNATSTNMFKCGKCGKRETTYYQLQTRSSDEPMTTFHTCTNCGNRWKS